jgi:hypothetical protein
MGCIGRYRNSDDDYWEMHSKDDLAGLCGSPGSAGGDAHTLAEPQNRSRIYLSSCSSEVVAGSSDPTLASSEGLPGPSRGSPTLDCVPGFVLSLCNIATFGIMIEIFGEGRGNKRLSSISAELFSFINIRRRGFIRDSSPSDLLFRMKALPVCDGNCEEKKALML